MDAITKHMQALGERLLRIGWADALCDKPKTFVIQWTPLGKKRLKELHGAIRELGCDPIPAEELAVLRHLAFLQAEEDGTA